MTRFCKTHAPERTTDELLAEHGRLAGLLKSNSYQSAPMRAIETRRSIIRTVLRARGVDPAEKST